MTGVGRANFETTRAEEISSILRSEFIREIRLKKKNLIQSRFVHKLKVFYVTVRSLGIRLKRMRNHGKSIRNIEHLTHNTLTIFDFRLVNSKSNTITLKHIRLK